MKLNICHLYPDLLDLYGDRGNILTLTARSKWRGIEPLVEKATIGADLNFKEIDILFIGGGSDREQSILVEDLMRREADLRYAIEDGLVVLTICGGYQLLGQYYQTLNGEKIPGLGILDMFTIAGSKRLIGNVVIELNNEAFSSDQKGIFDKLVGFENHSGKTYLSNQLTPLGRVLYGSGNNGEDSSEGLRYRNVFGTYLHGPLLPKNPHLADLLIKLALERRGYNQEISMLNDSLEELAHNAIVKRFLG